MADLADIAVKCYYQVKYAQKIQSFLPKNPTKITNMRSEPLFSHQMMQSQGQNRVFNFPAVQHAPPPQPASGSKPSIQTKSPQFESPLTTRL